MRAGHVQSKQTRKKLSYCSQNGKAISFESVSLTKPSTVHTFEEIWSWYFGGCPPSNDSSHHQEFCIFCINLPFHHYYWQGGQPELYFKPDTWPTLPASVLQLRRSKEIFTKRAALQQRQQTSIISAVVWFGKLTWHWKTPMFHWMFNRKKIIHGGCSIVMLLFGRVQLRMSNVQKPYDIPLHLFRMASYNTYITG